MSETRALPKPVSNGRAILIGQLGVNWTAVVIELGGWWGGLMLADHLRLLSLSVGAVGLTLSILVCLVVPFGFAVAWFSYACPKWRLWAMSRTDDWPALEARALGAGILHAERNWLDRLFTRAEIWTLKDRQRETELLAKHGLPPRRGS